MRIAVVTDSTCDLPSSLAEGLGVRVVPLTVTFGGLDAVSRATIADEDFYRDLAAADELPTTSQPSTPWFDEAWADAADSGYDAVVSLHVSAGLSGTVERARARASSARLPVEVVDSAQVSGGLALQVLAAARAAHRGGDTAAVVAAAAAVRAETTSVLAVDSLAHLRRGGRLGGRHATTGTSLRVRPVLVVADGRIDLLDRARTWRRALERLVDEVERAAGDEPQSVVIAHALDDDRADELATAVRRRVAVAAELRVVIGPVVGTHTGPGAVGIASAPATLVG